MDQQPDVFGEMARRLGQPPPAAAPQQPDVFAEMARRLGTPPDPQQPDVFAEMARRLAPQAPSATPRGTTPVTTTPQPYGVTPLAPAAIDRSTWGPRADGSAKGDGFLGVLKRPDGRVSSEISVGVTIDGKEVEIPTLVPTLTPAEVKALLARRDKDPIPPSILQKAQAHAIERIAAGKSPFAGPDDRAGAQPPASGAADAPVSIPTTPVLDVAMPFTNRRAPGEYTLKRSDDSMYAAPPPPTGPTYDPRAAVEKMGQGAFKLVAGADSPAQVMGRENPVARSPVVPPAPPIPVGPDGRTSLADLRNQAAAPTPPTEIETRLSGASDIVEGGLDLASPLLLPALAAQPEVVLPMLLRGYGAQAVAKAVGDKIGLNPQLTRLGSNIAGLIAGGRSEEAADLLKGAREVIGTVEAPRSGEAIGPEATIPSPQGEGAPASTPVRATASQPVPDVFAEMARRLDATTRSDGPVEGAGAHRTNAPVTASSDVADTPVALPASASPAPAAVPDLIGEVEKRVSAPTDTQAMTGRTALTVGDDLPITRSAPREMAADLPITRSAPRDDESASRQTPVTPSLPASGAARARPGRSPITGTGDLKARGLSEGIEAKAITNKLTETFGDLPEYRQVSMADQADRAAKLLSKDYERAKAIAMGRQSTPQGLLPESVLVAVENRAIAEGDVETIRQLATNSSLSVEATTMGQRIRTLAERDPESPVGAVKAVQDARLQAFEARGRDLAAEKKAFVQELQDHLTKTAPTKETWASFVESIRC